MTHWRASEACLHRADLILLDDRAFRNWFNLMCIASADNGVLPSIRTVAVKMRMSESRAAAAITETVFHGLFQRREDGKYAVVDWNSWQGVSAGAIRMRRSRSRRKSATCDATCDGRQRP